MGPLQFQANANKIVGHETGLLLEYVLQSMPFLGQAGQVLKPPGLKNYGLCFPTSLRPFTTWSKYRTCVS